MGHSPGGTHTVRNILAGWDLDPPCPLPLTPHSFPFFLGSGAALQHPLSAPEFCFVLFCILCCGYLERSDSLCSSDLRKPSCLECKLQRSQPILISFPSISGSPPSWLPLAKDSPSTKTEQCPLEPSPKHFKALAHCCIRHFSLKPCAQSPPPASSGLT